MINILYLINSLNTYLVAHKQTQTTADHRLHCSLCPLFSGAKKAERTMCVISCLLYSSSDTVDDVIDGDWKFKIDGGLQGFGILTF